MSQEYKPIAKIPLIVHTSGQEVTVLADVVDVRIEGSFIVIKHKIHTHGLDFTNVLDISFKDEFKKIADRLMQKALQTNNKYLEELANEYLKVHNAIQEALMNQYGSN